MSKPILCRQAFTALRALDISRCPQLGAGVGGLSALTELRLLRLFEISKLKDSALRQALPPLTRRDGCTGFQELWRHRNRDR